MLGISKAGYSALRAVLQDFSCNLGISEASAIETESQPVSWNAYVEMWYLAVTVYHHISMNVL